MLDLQQIVNKWIPILRLQDWDITILYGNRETTENMLGKSRISRNLKIVSIFICSPELIDPNWLGSKDIEETIVHELIHLHCSYFDSSFKENTLESENLEVMIDKIAIALVKLDRKTL